MNHTKELRILEAHRTCAKRYKELAELQEEKIFGKNKESPFYGLKNPSETKIINYIGDKYNVCNDILEIIQKNINKKKMKENIKNIRKRYPSFNGYQGPIYTECKKKYQVSSKYPMRYKENYYWFGAIRIESYRMPWGLFCCNIIPLTTIKNTSKDHYLQNKLTKKHLMKMLDKCNIKYKKSSSKEELYRLVISKGYDTIIY